MAGKLVLQGLGAFDFEDRFFGRLAKKVLSEVMRHPRQIRTFAHGRKLPIFADIGGKVVLSEANWGRKEAGFKPFSSSEHNLVLDLPRVLIPASHYLVEPKGMSRDATFAMRHKKLNPMMIAGVATDNSLKRVFVIGAKQEPYLSEFVPLVIPKKCWRRWIAPHMDVNSILRRFGDLEQVEFVPIEEISQVHSNEAWRLVDSEGFAELVPTDNSTLIPPEWRGDKDGPSEEEWRRHSLQAEAGVDYLELARPDRGIYRISRLIRAIQRRGAIRHPDMVKLADALQNLMDKKVDFDRRLRNFARSLNLSSQAGRPKGDSNLMLQKAIAWAKHVELSVDSHSRNEAITELAKAQFGQDSFDGRTRTLQRWISEMDRLGSPPTLVLM